MKRYCSLMLLIAATIVFGIGSADAQKVLKVLAVGNSFSEDAVEQNLYELARVEGDSLVIGNAYIGGCSIDRHWSNAQTGKAEYGYRKLIGGVKTGKNNVTLEEIVRDEPWDIITVQQASPLSGQFETYGNLQNLINYLRQTAVNKDFRLAFHMTWAYAQVNKHSGFANYSNDQMTMYRSILGAVKQATKKNKIKYVIPDGTAIQNARVVLGDSLCRDGYHLSLSIGRYIVACTWCEFLTGKNVVGNTFRPASVTAEKAAVAQKAAHFAIKRPYKLSASKMKK